jgi:hypothetical protein
MQAASWPGTSPKRIRALLDAGVLHAAGITAGITASRSPELEKVRRQQEREAKRLGALVSAGSNSARECADDEQFDVHPISDRSCSAAL